MKFDVSQQDFPAFFAWLPARYSSTIAPWLHFQALHHMKPQKGENWRRWSRQAWRYFLSWGRRTASRFRCMLDGASRFVMSTSRIQSVWCFQRFLMSRSVLSSDGVDIPSVSSTSRLRPGLIWGLSRTTDVFLAKVSNHSCIEIRLGLPYYNESSGGKVVKHKLDLVMALDD